MKSTKQNQVGILAIKSHDLSDYLIWSKFSMRECVIDMICQKVLFAFVCLPADDNLLKNVF